MLIQSLIDTRVVYSTMVKALELQLYCSHYSFARKSSLPHVYAQLYQSQNSHSDVG